MDLNSSSELSKTQRRIYNIALIFIFIMFSTLSITYSLLTPTFEGPDERWHYLWSKEKLENKEPANYVYLQPLYYVVNALFLKFLPHPTIVPDNENEKFLSGDPNRFIHFIEEKFPFEGNARAVHILRFFSIGCGLVTLYFIYKTSNLVFTNKWLSLFSIAVVSLIPKFIFINSVMNPDVLVWSMTTISIYFLLRYINEPKKIIFLILLTTFSALSVISKQNGIILVPVIITAFVYLLFSKQFNKSEFLKSVLLFGIIYFVVGGAYLLNAYFLNPGHSLEVVDPALAERQSNFKASMDYGIGEISNFHIYYNNFKQFWGYIGFHVFPPPAWVTYTALGFVTSSVAGLVLRLVKKTPSFSTQFKKNHALILFSAVSFMILGMIFFIFWVDGGDIRYTFPVISCYVILFVMGFYTLIDKPKLNLLSFLPLIFLVLVNISLISEMNEQYDNGFKIVSSTISQMLLYVYNVDFQNIFVDTAIGSKINLQY